MEVVTQQGFGARTGADSELVSHLAEGRSKSWDAKRLSLKALSYFVLK